MLNNIGLILILVFVSIVVVAKREKCEEYIKGLQHKMVNRHTVTPVKVERDDVETVGLVTSTDTNGLTSTAYIVFPDVSKLTNVTTLASAWYSCDNVSVSNMIRVTTITGTWFGCSKVK